MPYKNKDDAIRASRKRYQNHREARIKYEYESRAIRIITGSRWSKTYMDSHPDKVAAMVKEFLEFRKQQKVERRKQSQARRREYLKAYNKANAEHMAAYRFIYNQAHKEEIRRYHAKRSVTHKDEHRKYHTAHRAANREKLNQRAAETYRQNPEYEARRRAAYYQQNKERLLERQALYRKLYPEKNSNRSAKRRALLKGAQIGDTALILAWEKKWRKKHRVRCYWCGKMRSPKNCHADHINPLARGGVHELGNLAACCRRCNTSKGAKLKDDWNKQLTQPVLL